VGKWVMLVFVPNLDSADLMIGESRGRFFQHFIQQRDRGKQKRIRPRFFPILCGNHATEMKTKTFVQTRFM
jgi:hypothetical protein